MEQASSFVPNMKRPVHGWFRFSAGYAAAWAEATIAEHSGTGPVRVLDPFCGSGTTLIAAEHAGARAVGVESHPFLLRLARAKLGYRTDPGALRRRVVRIRERAEALPGSVDRYPPLIRRCFTDDVLRELDRLRHAWEELDDRSSASELAWLALVSILRPVSHVGTAPWQYILPSKRKRRPADPRSAFDEQVERMLEDMHATAGTPGPAAEILRGDARALEPIADRSIDLVLTSPPYPNNFDYADTTRLEMSFLGEIAGWRDLQATVRRHLVRSCSQHCSERELDLNGILVAPELAPLGAPLAETCAALADLRTRRAGRKTYHLMVACYFLDMARVWSALRRVCREGSQLCLVLGDSAPYGVHVPVAEWMSTLALSAGFRSTRFEKTRDRNTRWRNRKHRVPLCEGRLWVSG